MDGAFFIDKDNGCTSRDVVNEVIKKVETTKVGHTGTLDPMATGVLIVCFGKATKLVDLLTSEHKGYEAEITLGISTDTDDITGTILEEETVNITKDDVIKVLESFKGEYMQTVPIYSAVKINGKKLYEYARAGIQVELPKRLVSIDDIELISDVTYKDGRTIFSIRCNVSKGTYIRSLAKDIAIRLNTIGCMSKLRRIKQGNVLIDECKKIDDISLKDRISIKELLKEFDSIVVDDVLKKDILNGKIIDDIYNKDKVVFIDGEDNVLAIYSKYEKDNTKIKPYVMLGGVK